MRVRVGMCVLAAVICLVSALPGEAPVEGRSDAQRAGFRHLGVASCIPCHQQPHGEDPGFAAVDIWRTHDPHARAHVVLEDSLSDQMTQLLRLRSPTSEPLCLSCHAAPVPAEAEPRHPAPIDCESCHGPAEKWLTEHSREGWAKLSPDTKATAGFVDLRSMTRRVEACLPCHSGAGEQDVNHDLLAAGHPPLTFEFTASLGRLPSHWRSPWDQPDNERHAQRDGAPVAAALKLLAVANDCQQAAALDLLAERASHPQRPWPELAEYDCFGCHQELTQARRNKGGSSELGLPAWGAWQDFNGVIVPQSPDLQAALLELRASLRLERVPDRNSVANSARALAHRLRTLARERESMLPAPEAMATILRPPAEGAMDHPGRALLRLQVLTGLRSAFHAEKRDVESLDLELRQLQQRLTDRISQAAPR